MRIATTTFGTLATIVGVLGLIVGAGIQIDARLAVVAGLLIIAATLAISAFVPRPRRALDPRAARDEEKETSLNDDFVLPTATPAE